MSSAALGGGGVLGGSLDRWIEDAYSGYRDLLEKFPRSVRLLRAYAGFCDVVLNRAAEAAQLNAQAAPVPLTSCPLVPLCAGL